MQIQLFWFGRQNSQYTALEWFMQAAHAKMGKKLLLKPQFWGSAKLQKLSDIDVLVKSYQFICFCGNQRRSNFGQISHFSLIKVRPKIAVFWELLALYGSFDEFLTLFMCNSCNDVI